MKNNKTIYITDKNKWAIELLAYLKNRKEFLRKKCEEKSKIFLENLKKEENGN